MQLPYQINTTFFADRSRLQSTTLHQRAPLLQGDARPFPPRFLCLPFPCWALPAETQDPAQGRTAAKGLTPLPPPFASPSHLRSQFQAGGVDSLPLEAQGQHVPPDMASRPLAFHSAEHLTEHSPLTRSGARPAKPTTHRRHFPPPATKARAGASPALPREAQTPRDLPRAPQGL